MHSHIICYVPEKSGSLPTQYASFFPSIFFFSLFFSFYIYFQGRGRPLQGRTSVECRFVRDRLCNEVDERLEVMCARFIWVSFREQPERAGRTGAGFRLTLSVVFFLLSLLSFCSSAPLPSIRLASLPSSDGGDSKEGALLT